MTTSTEFRPFIYGLYDPLDPGHIRYVGMAPVNPLRPYAHAINARKKVNTNSYLLNWVRKLQAEGREYGVLILEERLETTTPKFLGEIEKMYIKSLREIGHRLTNVSEGGLGSAGCTPKPEETKQKMSDARSNAWANGKYDSEETRKKFREDKLGKTFSHSDEAKEKISQALTGRIQSEEWREKNRQAQLGKKDSSETLLKKSESAKKRWAKRLASGYTVSQETRDRILTTKLKNNAWRRAYTADTSLNYIIWSAEYDKGAK